jgi:hypothetical protein
MAKSAHQILNPMMEATVKLAIPKELFYLSLYLITITLINLPHGTVLQVKHFFGIL